MNKSADAEWMVEPSPNILAREDKAITTKPPTSDMDYSVLYVRT